ncbi:MAG: TIGR00730 family Rossman fold protein [Sphingobacteriia bacterium]|nr:TIGR00730 family Rossman fold protein [Sphingobacteriia bacterium]
MYKNAAVFCGSKHGKNELFSQHAKEIGWILAEQNIQLVYGGGKVGLMGTVANAALEKGGKVIGVIPKVLVNWEQQHTGITDLRIVEDMHSRKKLMYELADFAIILPGGNGTLDELFEMITWNTLKIHEKKVLIINTSQYYRHLIAHMEQMFENEFLYENWMERIFVINDPKEIISFLNPDKN